MVGWGWARKSRRAGETAASDNRGIRPRPCRLAGRALELSLPVLKLFAFADQTVQRHLEVQSATGVDLLDVVDELLRYGADSTAHLAHALVGVVPQVRVREDVEQVVAIERRGRACAACRRTRWRRCSSWPSALRRSIRANSSAVFVGDRHRSSARSARRPDFRMPRAPRTAEPALRSAGERASHALGHLPRRRVRGGDDEITSGPTAPPIAAIDDRAGEHDADDRPPSTRLGDRATSGRRLSTSDCTVSVSASLDRPGRALGLVRDLHRLARSRAPATRRRGRRRRRR